MIYLAGRTARGSPSAINGRNQVFPESWVRIQCQYHPLPLVCYGPGRSGPKRANRGPFSYWV